MNQQERLDYLLKYFFNELHIEYSKKQIQNPHETLRALMNSRPPQMVDKKTQEILDDYLHTEIQNKGIIKLSDLKPMKDHLYLYQGDITCLKVDGIVNAANSQMLGCFIPCHHCIDNAIHTYAGIQLRNRCDELMKQRGKPLATGEALITLGYNLPSHYIIHTVGPIIDKQVTLKDEELLRSCYRECLNLAHAYQLQSLAFCCISTGEFHFPHQLAAQIALQEIETFLKESSMDIVINVFKDEDLHIYQKLLGE